MSDLREDMLAHCMKMRPIEYAKKYRELEEQLEEKDYILSELHEILGVTGSYIDTAQKIRKQLADSVPKSEIEKVLKHFDSAEKDEYCFETLYKYMADEIEKLLTPPAKESEL